MSTRLDPVIAHKVTVYGEKDLSGDPDQTDLLPELSGLADIADRLEPLANVSVNKLEQVDIVRHPLVGEMLAVL
jgi:phosphate starvation-inducible PhoH-like protein